MKLVALCLGLFCALLFAMPAWAEPNEADRATARALALEGHAALEKKDYATAADRFGRADALVHAPTLVVDWARALTGLGRLVEAHEKYELVLREGVDSSSPKSWLHSLEDAKRELDAIKPRLAWITVVLKEPSDATVKISGVVVPPAALGVKRAADPGFPKVIVTATGYETFEQTVSVGPGEEKSLEVTLKKLPEAVADEPQPLPRPNDAYRPRQHGSARKVMTYVAFGLGGAGLIAGGVMGGLALHKRTELKKDCIEDVCPSSSQQGIDDYHTFGTISGVALAVGVAGVGTGLVLWLTEPKSEETASASRAKLSLRPVIGLGMIGAEGSFQ